MRRRNQVVLLQEAKSACPCRHDGEDEPVDLSPYCCSLTFLSVCHQCGKECTMTASAARHGGQQLCHRPGMNLAPQLLISTGHFCQEASLGVASGLIVSAVSPQPSTGVYTRGDRFESESGGCQKKSVPRGSLKLGCPPKKKRSLKLGPKYWQSKKTKIVLEWASAFWWMH